MAEITLGDLLAWEPRLRAMDGSLYDLAGRAGVGARTAGGAQLDRELTWAVAARATPPMLPPLRGGELVLLPRRILAEAGVSLPLLLLELAGHGAAGAVIEEGEAPPVRAPLPVLGMPAGAMAPGQDLEGELNRLLTQRRGELYRAGTELGRSLTALTTADAGIAPILAATAALGMPAAVVDGRGSALAASGPEAVPPAGGGTPSVAAVDRVAVPLAGGETLWLGPVPAERRALARLVGERVAVSAEAALARTAQQRPRGPARASALGAFLLGGAGDAVDIGARVTALGLAVEGAFRVALGQMDGGAMALERRLAPLGLVHDAGSIDGLATAVVEVRVDGARGSGGPSPGAGPRVEGRPGGVGEARIQPRGQAGRGWLALSGVVGRAGELPAAAREARYVAALLAAGAVAGPVARFDALADMGAHRLLYRLWGTPELAGFAAAALGDLPARDRRGTLRRTLLIYLETGGSHVDAAARLGIHRNTLSYRLKQIAAVTGRNPADPETRLVLHLGLLAAALPPAPVEG